MKEYLTVSEFAEAVGKSRQTVYKQLTRKLTEFTRQVDNRTMIHKSAISKVYGIAIDTEVDTGLTESLQNETDRLTEVDKGLTHTEAYIRRLEKDLEAAEEREYNQARLIEELTTSLQVMNMQNQNLLIENQNLKALMEPEAASTGSEEPEAAIPEEPQKKSFWSKFRRVKP